MASAKGIATSQTANKKKQIYPLYLVVDSSKSMGEPVAFLDKRTRMDVAKGFPEGIYDLYGENQDLVANLRVSLLTFNRYVKQDLFMSPVSSILDVELKWEPRMKTFFAQLFDYLHDRIQKDFEEFGSKYEMHNPAIVILTDGLATNNPDANESEESRLAAYKKLLSIDKFNQPIQIAMYGIGDASEDFLRQWATKPKLATKADGDSQLEQLEKLIVELKKTLRTSLKKPARPLPPQSPELNISEFEDEDDTIW